VLSIEYLKDYQQRIGSLKAGGSTNFVAVFKQIE
jgi:hypothetical protein